MSLEHRSGHNEVTSVETVFPVDTGGTPDEVSVKRIIESGTSPHGATGASRERAG